MILKLNDTFSDVVDIVWNFLICFDKNCETLNFFICECNYPSPLQSYKVFNDLSKNNTLKNFSFHLPYYWRTKIQYFNFHNS
jgi:hypothetical protein